MMREREYRDRCTTRMSKIFFFKDTATTEIYTLSLHDALPISAAASCQICHDPHAAGVRSQLRAAGNGLCLACHVDAAAIDRKSTRLNSSHANISYAVFCLKKKNITLRVLLLRISPSSYFFSSS